LILEVVNNTDDEFDTADIVDGDDVDKNSIGKLIMFEVADEIDGDFDTADNDDNFGYWYFIFVFARWSPLSNSSLFLMFEDVNEKDGDFDTADNDDGDDTEKKSVEDRDDTVDGVETNGLVSANNEPTAADTFE
jgi:hypothetical protein